MAGTMRMKMEKMMVWSMQVMTMKVTTTLMMMIMVTNDVEKCRSGAENLNRVRQK